MHGSGLKILVMWLLILKMSMGVAGVGGGVGGQLIIHEHRSVPVLYTANGRTSIVYIYFSTKRYTVGTH